MEPLEHDEGKKRSLPILIFGDESASMNGGGKIDAVNSAGGDLAVRIGEFAAKNPLVVILIQVIVFGGKGARAIFPDWVKAQDFSWKALAASGGTPMGAAFSEGERQLDQLPEDATFYPAVFGLLSDGQPTDEWEGPLGAFLSSPHGGGGTKISIAIGSDADRECLGRFCAGSEVGVLEAHNAAQLVDAIVLKTMEASREAVSGRSYFSQDGVTAPSMRSEVNGDLPEQNLDGSIIDSASQENRLW